MYQLTCTNDNNGQSIVLCISSTNTKSMKEEKVAVVTGTSTGIGYETSLSLARNGFITYATMRNVNKGENIKSIATKESLPVHVNLIDYTLPRKLKCY
jgi:NAD(P)-dependent dehydrogenase (short-subunit alcohol dehydrogenase family)